MTELPDFGEDREMNWTSDLLAGTSTTHTVFVLAVAIAVGLAVGQIKIYGISLGIAGVLFVALALGHFGFTIQPEILDFARDFGLALFVFTIGLQVGPGFFASLRRQGLRLNLLAAAIVLVGMAIATFAYFALGLPLPAMVGLLSGAVTNTPGLGAAQQAFASLGTGAGELLPSTADAISVSGMAYAVAYPFGVIGIILAMILLRALFRVDVGRESAELEAEQSPARLAPGNFNIRVANPRLAGAQIRELAGLVQAEFVVSRLLRGGEVMVVKADTILAVGDILHVVSTREGAEKLAIVAGELSETDVRQVASKLGSRKLLITRQSALGRSVGELDLLHRYGVVITRVQRAGVELVAGAGLRLAFGDRITVVGDSEAIGRAAAELGDSLKALNAPNILSVFFGLIAGVILGTLPFDLPGLPAPIRLGLAGGPLIVALVLGRLGKVGPLVFWLPQSANLALREIGITLFLATVGLKSGVHFVETVGSSQGLLWMAVGALVTFLPLFLVGLGARLVGKINFASLAGLLAGSMTDPPALSFSQTLTGSDAPAVTYASVYALVMFLRIVGAQALVLLLAH
ncbi:MAG TPA: putative transporter [Rectinemataceae bacterium]|nr:putative transporter [Rectinemataceae bacterium]